MPAPKNLHTETIDFRVTPAQKEVIHHMAQENNQTVASLVRRMLGEKAINMGLVKDWGEWFRLEDWTSDGR